MTLRHALASLLLLGAVPALAAGRVPYGGELRVAHTGPAEPGTDTALLEEGHPTVTRLVSVDERPGVLEAAQRAS